MEELYLQVIQVDALGILDKAIMVQQKWPWLVL